MVDKYIKLMLPFSKSEMGECVRSAIDDNSKDRLAILTAAFRLDMDPNHILMNDFDLLHYAILKNDIATTGFLIKHGADFHKKVFDSGTILHLCASFGHNHLLKFFIDKKIKIDDIDSDGDSALIVACKLDKDECIKILLDNKANVNFRTPSGLSSFDIIIQKMFKRSKYLPIFQYIMKAKTDISNKELRLIRCLCLPESFTVKSVIIDHNELSEEDKLMIVKTVVEKFPHSIKISCDKDSNTWLHHALIANFKTIVDYLLNIKELDLYQKNKLGRTYLHLAAQAGNIGWVRFLLEKGTNKVGKQLKDILCDNGRTVIEYALFPTGERNLSLPGLSGERNLKVISTCHPSWDPPHKKTDEDIIGIIKILVEAGIDINSRNRLKFRAIDYAIQHASIPVINEMISLGANITAIRTKNRVFPPVTNNDLVGVATQFGRLDVVQLLLEKQSQLHMYIMPNKDDESSPANYQSVPTALVIALRQAEYGITLFLLGLDKTKATLNSRTKEFLLDIAIEEGCLDKNILTHFVPEPIYSEQYAQLEISMMDKYEIIIRRHIRNYHTMKPIILRSLASIIFILKKIYNFRNKNHIYEIFIETDDLYESLARNSKLIEELIIVISLMINYPYPTDIKYCITVVKAIGMQNMVAETMKMYLHRLKELDLYKKINELNEAHRIIKLLGNTLDKKYWHIGHSNSSDDDISSDDEIYDGATDDERNYESDDDMDDIDSTDSDSIDDSDDDSDEEKLPEPTLQKIPNKFIQGFRYHIPKLDTNLSEQITQPLRSIPEYTETVQIEKALFKLHWPIKHAHYRRMYGLLKNAPFDYSHQVAENKLVVIDQDGRIVAMVYPFDNYTEGIDMFHVSVHDKPSRWIKYYAPNIGKNDKCDENHMFPFILDSLLAEWVCIERKVKDPTHIGGTDALIYFYGKLWIGTEMVVGCFEYFINSFGTLFHRLFRPQQYVPVRVRNLLSTIIV